MTKLSRTIFIQVLFMFLQVIAIRGSIFGFSFARGNNDIKSIKPIKPSIDSNQAVSSSSSSTSSTTVTTANAATLNPSGKSSGDSTVTATGSATTIFSIGSNSVNKPANEKELPSPIPTSIPSPTMIPSPKVPLSTYYGEEIQHPFLHESDMMDTYNSNKLEKNPYSRMKSESSGVFSGESSNKRIVTDKTRSMRRLRPVKSRHILSGVIDWFPKVDLRIDPVINYKFKQRINLLGACVTLGMDYLSDIPQWRAYCSVEDNIVGGRFSLRGSELGWTKAWLWNLGLMQDNMAKFKLRMGLNLKTYKAYARLRFRTEPISPFDIGDGISCAGKLPLTLLLPVLRDLPLRVEYRMRINTNQPAVSITRNQRDGRISISTGIDKIDLSLDELNFCLEWDERSPVWGIGIVRSDKSFIPNLSSFTKRFYLG